ncbi:tRNA 4-demethylwyosine alpha-amino-alpha-carboxypropyltransferase Trm12 [Schizosaccharomyces osmophilus]|uniref:tRNA wybutosine-synthesizing protein 2 n=1 Tax=Schizosaccharomyces osmophilus TaxID=2545709 RepID=A0AAE9WAW4_9SCHI|nr:tRNA 4-demethylwyosine alpha-amino-alpha-carboxypropyltransferase Trm12 [Schizosaccharomyces osmophilus]WBW72952.1 tRNA 4-demethylwyosine alpha-amino-alpha-carboxypropyltransferase Trm12 [Schizosaccharomyces osmophilus]
MISLLVPKSKAKQWKDYLQSHNCFLKSIGIVSGSKIAAYLVNQTGDVPLDKYVLIPTSYEENNLPKEIIDCCDLQIIHNASLRTGMERNSLQERVLACVAGAIGKRVAAEQFIVPTRFVIYPPMALLSSSSFSTKEWFAFFQQYRNTEVVNKLFSIFAEEWKVTHIALNEPIPINDIMRRPLALRPLYGNFGKPVWGEPSTEDFENAFWVHCRQNGIYQTWAPLYTMFSRGNSIEKARVLNFENIHNEVIADLYAGIGYFSFSYVKGKAKSVVCWEINPWSIEALRRAAIVNNWSVCVVRHNEDYNFRMGSHQLVVFHESNEYAHARLGSLDTSAKHVNLGMLPSSRDAWNLSASIVKREPGSFIHVHENVMEDRIERYGKEINEEFKNKLKMQTTYQVNRVKSFSPRVWHVVYDIRII